MTADDADASIGAGDYIVSPSYWQLIRTRAELTPDAIMLIEAGGRRLSFSEYANRAERLAAALHSIGIGADTWVTWQMPTGLLAALLVGALARLGAVQNPIIHLYREREVVTVLRQNGSTFFIVPSQAHGQDLVMSAHAAIGELKNPPKVISLDERFTGNPADLPPAPSDADAARWVFYTSGTTADPKGAIHCDLSLISAGAALARSYRLRQGDVGALAFPIAHIGGPMYLAEILSSGAAALVMERFVPAEAVELFQKYGVSACGGSTAHYLALLGEQARQPGVRLLPRLRVFGGGGAAKAPDIFFRVKQELGAIVSHTYGMTECPCITVAPVDSSDEQLAYSDGTLHPDVELRIVQSDGQLAPANVEGEIRIRGRGMFRGYTDSRLDAEAFDAEGFYRTGDLGFLREDCRLCITGRIKDVIIRKGENISARELEDLLHAHPKVRAVAVIGLPDAERGERVCAVVELREGVVGSFGFAEMVEYFTRLDVMRQKIPEQLEVVERLPRSNSLNKILKNRLRGQFGVSR